MIGLLGRFGVARVVNPHAREIESYVAGTHADAATHELDQVVITPV